MKRSAILSGLVLAAVMAAGIATAWRAEADTHQAMGPAAGMGMGMGKGMSSMMMRSPFAAIDSNHDKVLSPDEVKAFIASKVDGLDANHDGFLTADEIAAQGTKLFKARVTAQAEAMVKKLDTDGDGKLSLAELDARPMPMQGLIDRMLKAGNGKITKEAFDATRERMGDRAMLRHEGAKPGDHAGMGAMGKVKGMGGLKFDAIDANHDGALTEAEIKAYYDGKLNAMDANHDGFVTVDEIVAARMARAEPRIKAMAERMVARLDLNGDGKISIEELAAAPLDMMFAHIPTEANGDITESQFNHALRRMHKHMHHRWNGDGHSGDRPAQDHGADMGGN